MPNSETTRKREPTGFNIHGETMAEYYQRRTNERGAEIEHLLAVVTSAYDSLHDDNDAFSAETVLRECLRKFNR
jgi:hypothetical protein